MQWAIIFFVDIGKLSKLMVQLSQYYHCSILELYKLPIVQLYDLVDVINTGAK